MEDGRKKMEEGVAEENCREIREILRSIVANVVYKESRRSTLKTYTRSEDSVRVCRFGSKCKRLDIFHWAESDHPSDHPLYGTPAPPPEPFKLTTLLECHHWTYKGFCGVGDECRFAHYASRRGVNMPLPTANHRRRDDKQGWRNRGRKNGNRGAAFRRFLMDTFGEAKLRSGTGVLDVAGGGAGGGGLAFQLLNYCNVPATVLDPRAPDHKKAIDRLVHAGPHRSSPFHARYDTDVTPKGQPARLPRFVMRKVVPQPPPPPPPLPSSSTSTAPPPPPSSSLFSCSSAAGFVESAEAALLGNKLEEGRARHKALVRARQRNGNVPTAETDEVADGTGTAAAAVAAEKAAATATAAQTANDAASAAAAAAADADHSVTDDGAIASIVAGASVVAGLHPDGATEPLVDWAIASGKPFAVVPCCVFWRFSDVLTELGVRSYEQFLAYLAEKLPEGQIRRDTLPFDGRNVVLWWPGRESNAGSTVDSTNAVDGCTSSLHDSNDFGSNTADAADAAGTMY